MLNRIIVSFIFVVSLVIAQSTQDAIRVRRIYNIRNQQTIDNRSETTARMNMHTFLCAGTVSWSCQLQYSDVSSSGPWSNFVEPSSLVTNASVNGNGSGFGYHPYIRISTTGTVTLTDYAGIKDVFLNRNTQSVSGILDYKSDIGGGPFVWDGTNSIWKPGGVIGDSKFVRFSGDEGPPTWPPLDSPYVFGRKISTSSDIGNFKNTMSIIQHSLFSTGTPAALYVEHDSDIQSSYGTTAIYARFNKSSLSSDVSFASHAEVFCDDCGGAMAAFNGEAVLSANSTKPVEIFGQVLQAGLLGSGVTTTAHSVIGQKVIMQYPSGGTNTQGGVWIEVGSGAHTYGLKITQSPSFGSTFAKAIDANGDIDLNTSNFLITNRPSTDAYSVAGLKFNVDGSTLATMGVENDGDISLSSGLLSRGDVTVNTGQRANFNRSSGSAADTAGINFKIDGVSSSILGVDNGNYIVASAGINAGTNTLASIAIAGENGAIVYCSDCNTPASPGAACASGGDGAGAMAMKVRGAWKCF